MAIQNKISILKNEIGIGLVIKNKISILKNEICHLLCIHPKELANKLMTEELKRRETEQKLGNLEKKMLSVKKDEVLKTHPYYLAVSRSSCEAHILDLPLAPL